MRIGQGYDAHRLVKARPLILGGVKINYDKGLEAHSDGDVIIHALCDALLGAAGLGDIGQHFPDKDPQYKNIDSRVLLRKIILLLQQEHMVVHNVDLTIVAQAPRLAPYVAQMRTCLAADLDLEPRWVNVKATTTEGMGFTGRGEGIACYAIVLVRCEQK